MPLNVRHSLLNKYRGPDDVSFMTVSGHITNFIGMLASRKDVRDHSTARLQSFVKSFEFPDMTTRHDDIYIASEGTFGWLLDDKEEASSASSAPPLIAQLISRASNTFNSWIRSKDPSKNLFWISGKAGAGKSTLMKFVTTHSRTRELLEGTYAKPAVLISHHFLLLGSAMQRSKKGMLCTLLSQLLGNLLRSDDGKPAVQEVFCVPEKSPETMTHEAWTERELETILCKALEIVGGTRCACVCLDGLDEFDPTDGPQPILDLISRLRTIHGVRAMVSSRPESLLEEHLRMFPHLALHDLTAADMYHFAYDQLQAVGSIREKSLIKDLAVRLVLKAEGVFLWTSLVVRNLTADLRAGSPVESLGQGLDRLPGDMVQLYESIWNRRNQDTKLHRSEAALYFQLSLDAVRVFAAIPGLFFRYWLWQSGGDLWEATHKKVTLLHFALASDEMMTRSVLMDRKTISDNVILAQCKATSSALSVRCAGILEVVPSQGTAPGTGGMRGSSDLSDVDPESPVRFLHRSAQEFFTNTERGQKILEHNKMLYSERFDRLVLASLARSWSFHSVVNRYGLCYPLPPSDLHRFLDSQ